MKKKKITLTDNKNKSYQAIILCSCEESEMGDVIRHMDEKTKCCCDTWYPDDNNVIAACDCYSHRRNEEDEEFYYLETILAFVEQAPQIWSGKVVTKEEASVMLKSEILFSTK